jgi:hypothetical protein
MASLILFFVMNYNEVLVLNPFVEQFGYCFLAISTWLARKASRASPAVGMAGSSRGRHPF